MGEGRKDRSAKRHAGRSRGINESSSDSELAESKRKARRSKLEERWPFLEGLTVDELGRYRRRRVRGCPKDTLGPRAEATGTDNYYTSEYRRAFRASSDDLLQENFWGDQVKPSEDLLRSDASRKTETGASQREDIREEPGASWTVESADEEAPMEVEPESSKIATHARPLGRPPLIRRGTSLKYEGDFRGNTEMYSSYVPHEGRHRAELARRPTSLRMEGEMATTTEKRDKFVEWLNVVRPELARVATHLKLEGEFETATENHDSYVPFVGARRPEILRQSDHLKHDVANTFQPECSNVFKQPLAGERQVPNKPETRPRPKGELCRATENSENFVDPRTREVQLMAELERDIEEEEKEKRELEERDTKDEEMQLLVSKLEDLKAPPLEVPEYRDAYKDFPRERPKLAKPEDEIGRADGSKVPSSSNRARFATKIDQDPEYKSRYLEYPRDRPLYRKPPLPASFSRRSSAGFGCGFADGGCGTRTRPTDCGRADDEPTSEARSRYVPYGHVPRVESLRMPTSLRLEGCIQLQPEYRNAYCAKTHCPSDSCEKPNYWANSENGERFGRVNAARDQDAFQVLNTRVHEESVVERPPPVTGSDRSPRGSVQTSRRRSPGPTYRLHVCNVDDEPRGFAQRTRSPPDLYPSSGRASPCPDAERPYSPSFGRQRDDADAARPSNGRAFVVLDKPPRDGRRGKRVDRSHNVDDRLPAPRGTSTNWMPPWYDGTSTI